MVKKTPKKKKEIIKTDSNKLNGKKALLKSNPFDNIIIQENENPQGEDESESLDLENLVNVSAPRYRPPQDRTAPMLELSSETQLDNLADIPTPDQATENANQPDNTPRYVQGSAALYGNSGNYDSNARNYDDTSGYPKLISAPEFLNKGPSMGFNQPSPFLGGSALRSSNDLASNEYPHLDESKKYDSPSEQKKDRRRY
jgi:hypothetical protein